MQTTCILSLFIPDIVTTTIRLMIAADYKLSESNTTDITEDPTITIAPNATDSPIINDDSVRGKVSRNNTSELNVSLKIIFSIIL